MYHQQTSFRVRYGETDQMGFVYYGDYAEYFEVGRVEAMRSIGFPYRRLEDKGVMLPVRDLRVTYHAPARYDDLITVVTYIEELPTVRFKFRYEVRNEKNELLTDAHTTLIFVRSDSMKPCKAPQELIEALKEYFV